MSDSTPAKTSREFAEPYDLYEELDRLEELLEDMIELGVSSQSEIEARMMLLNEQIDALEFGSGGP